MRQQCDNPQINAVVETALTGARAEEVLVIDERSWEVIANPVVSSGQVVGAVVLVMDVTEREQREQAHQAPYPTQNDDPYGDFEVNFEDVEHYDGFEPYPYDRRPYDEGEDGYE